MSMFGQSKTAQSKAAQSKTAQSKSGQKPLASLSSTLLARKGQAKPAMRPQGFGGFGGLPGQQDDLGWNDMGEPVEVDIHAAPLAPVPVPPVLLQREELAEELATPTPTPVTDVAPVELESVDPEPEASRALKPVSVATAARLGRETSKKRGRAAFTLRLDHDRHLRLRLASALHNASAQALVTEALDTFLQSLPEVDALIAQLPPRKTPKSKGE